MQFDSWFDPKLGGVDREARLVSPSCMHWWLRGYGTTLSIKAKADAVGADARNFIVTALLMLAWNRGRSYAELTA